MSTEKDNIHFDDPELKRALVRALPKVAAPASLRLRIGQGLDEMAVPHAPEPLTHSNPWHISNWFPVHRRLAFAAAIAGLGLGIGLYLASDNEGHGHSPTVASSPDQVIVQGALVRHDEMRQSMAANGDQFRRSLFTVPEVREQLRREASLPIPQGDLASDGWQLAGAKPCNMGGCCGAQIFYTRGRQTLSVFVFPAGRISPEMAAACQAKRDYRTAVRTLPNATLFVVARCPAGELSQAEVEQVATRLLDAR